MLPQNLKTLLLITLSAMTSTAFAEFPAEKYAGLWQVVVITQQHKLAIRPHDCTKTASLRRISAVDDNQIEITAGATSERLTIEREGHREFLNHKRRGEVLWEVPGETFLHAAGYYWHAYRRCPETNNPE